MHLKIMTINYKVESFTNGELPVWRIEKKLDKVDHPKFTKKLWWCYLSFWRLLKDVAVCFWRLLKGVTNLIEYGSSFGYIKYWTWTNEYWYFRVKTLNNWKSTLFWFTLSTICRVRHLLYKMKCLNVFINLCVCLLNSNEM